MSCQKQTSYEKFRDQGADSAPTKDGFDFGVGWYTRQKESLKQKVRFFRKSDKKSHALRHMDGKKDNSTGNQIIPTIGDVSAHWYSERKSK